MKMWTYFLASFVLLSAIPVMAYEPGKENAAEQMEFQIHSGTKHDKRQKYTFEDYLADLQASTHVGEIQRTNPVSRLAAIRNQDYRSLNPQDYKPLNAIRW